MKRPQAGQLARLTKPVALGVRCGQTGRGIRGVQGFALLSGRGRFVARLLTVVRLRAKGKLRNVCDKPPGYAEITPENVAERANRFKSRPKTGAFWL
jgi:hypothetical protein